MTEKNEFKVPDELLKSATFAMSLGSKELFHTNFLGFLLESDLEAIRPISNGLKKKLFGSAFHGALWVFRESKNLDLIVVPKTLSSNADYSAVVIEAKLKSIPTVEQLDGYNVKIGDQDTNGKKIRLDIGEIVDDKYDFVRLSAGDTIEYRIANKERKIGQHYQWDTAHSAAKGIRRLILAPTNPYSNTSTEPKSLKWEYCSWREIHDVLGRGLQDCDLDDHGIVSMVKSYANDLDKILNLLHQTHELVSKFCSGDFGVCFHDFDQSILEPFRRSRIHDLISKYAYWCLRENIRERLDAKGHKLNYGIHFSRGTPILEMEKSFHGYQIGVQIQGGQYRHFIKSIKPDEQLKNFVGNNLDWFSLVAPGIASVMDLNKFDDNKFLYSKKDMSSYGFNDLCNALAESFDKCRTE